MLLLYMPFLFHFNHLKICSWAMILVIFWVVGIKGGGGGGESIVTRRVFKIPLQKGWGFYFNGQAHFWEIVAHAYPPKQHTVVGCMH